jgi:hypothetical protein
MVKNQGGNKSKRMGRKFMSTGPSRTRFSEDPDEIYACCTKMHGPSCDVLCIDGKTRLCFIRNKFKGRGKRDSLIAIGTWLLVGRRGFEGERVNKKENSDLLEVYSENDKRILLQHEHDKKWDIFSSTQRIDGGTSADDSIMDGFDFCDDNTTEYENLINSTNNSQTNNVVSNKLGNEDTDEDEDFDVDDL